MRHQMLTLSALRSASLLVCVSAFSIVEVATVHATPIVPIRSLYLVPSDRAPNADYATAIDAALFDLQAWYADQLGGPTFGIATPRVEIVSTAHPASYYSTPRGFPGTSSDFFFNVFEEATSVGVVLDDPAFRWAVYIDAEAGPGQFGGAALGGVTIIAAPDLRGLIGQEPAPVSRWIGGLGHELGHTFGLPHPNDCLAPFPAGGCPYNPLNYPPDVTGGALMQFGYLTYPNTYLLPEERQFLRTTPYIGRIESPPPVPEPASLVLLLAGTGATAYFRRRSRRSRQIYCALERIDQRAENSSQAQPKRWRLRLCSTFRERLEPRGVGLLHPALRRPMGLDPEGRHPTRHDVHVEVSAVAGKQPAHPVSSSIL